MILLSGFFVVPDAAMCSTQGAGGGIVVVGPVVSCADRYKRVGAHQQWEAHRAMDFAQPAASFHLLARQDSSRCPSGR